MAVKFLSADWTDAVESALQNHDGFQSAMGSNELTLQFNISDTPDGDVAYYLKHTGATEMSLGTAEDADVTIGQNYDTATSIFKGDLNTQTAFMTGKLKVSGNLAKLMMHQAAIQQMQSAVSQIDVEY